MSHPHAPSPGQSIFSAIQQKLACLLLLLNISVIWCPRHSGIIGNEMADILARKTVDNDGPDIFPTKGNFNKTRSIITAHLSKGLPPPLPGPRGPSSLLRQLHSGHCSLNDYLFKRRRRTDPLCPFCKQRETVPHLINHCTQLRPLGRLLRKSLRRKNIKFNSNRLDLSLLDPKAAFAFATFLSRTGRFPFLTAAPV